MYSGHHVTTKQGTQKIISEGDILNYKKAAEMKRHYHLTRRFQPGINYILVEMIEKNSKSDGGIIIQVGEDDAMNTTDVATKTAKL
jgi:co-chaperonin GroES (HSP10)